MSKYNDMLNNSQNGNNVNQPILGKNMVKNNTGGFVFELSPIEQFRRFLTIGVKKGSYYETADQMFQRQVEIINKVLDANYLEAIGEIVYVSENNLAASNDEAILALALASAHSNENCRKLALSKLPVVCRTPTMLFQFIEISQKFRGWGSAYKRAIQDWYNQKGLETLSMQMVKYRQRDGVSQRDALRQAHPRTEDSNRNGLYAFACNGFNGSLSDSVVTVERRLPKSGKSAPVVTENVQFSTESMPSVEGYLRAKSAHSAKDIVYLIEKYRLTQEMIPTEYLSDVSVQAALVKEMPINALLRNLGRYTSTGVFTSFGDLTKLAISKFEDPRNLKKLHPITILNASKMYSRGYGEKSNLRWSPNQNIVEALDEAFYESFKHVEPTGKNYFLGVDTSGSMGMATGIGALNCFEVALAMMMVTHRTEKFCETYSMCSTKLHPLTVGRNDRMSDLVSKYGSIPFGDTGLSQLIEKALNNKIKVDGFVLYTDNEVNAGGHPAAIFDKYRKTVNPEARMIVCAMTATSFSVADPKDKYQLDISGFSSATPSVISNFMMGKI